MKIMDAKSICLVYFRTKVYSNRSHGYSYREVGLKKILSCNMADLSSIVKGWGGFINGGKIVILVICEQF